MVKQNTMMDKLRRGETVIGTQIRTCDPRIAEVLGLSGFDFIYIESEHFAFNMETIEHLIRACDLTNTTSLLRVPTRDEGVIGQYLDMGVGGLILPHVDTREEADSLVKACRYPPLGERGFSNTSRSVLYGFMPVPEYRTLSNKNVALMPMIESQAAIKNLDEILESGIDLIRVGLRDLSSSFGYGGEQSHPDFQAAVDHILAVAAKRNIPVGCAVGSIEEAEQMIARGFRQISFSSELVMLKNSAVQALDRLRQNI